MDSARKDFVAGCIGGAGQLVVGHPFDTIKVKLQSQTKGPDGKVMYNGCVDATKKVLSKEGPAGLFKGMGAPLATVAVFNAVLFTTRGKMEKALAHKDGSPLTIKDQMFAGMGAGVAGSLVACPTELIKCRLQAPAEAIAAGVPGAAYGLPYKGPIDVFLKVLTTEGFTGLYRGLAPTLAREIPGNAIMFGSYELLKQQARDMKGLSRDEPLDVGSLVLAGGLAGMAYWLPVYPMDVIKSKIQINLDSRPDFRKILPVARQILTSSGGKGFYVGLGPAMARAFPANGACFMLYELTIKGLNQIFSDEE